MKRQKYWISIGLSLISGLVVSMQVYLTHRTPIPVSGSRVLVAAREIPKGSRLNPRDITFRWMPTIELLPGMVTDQMAHPLWGRELTETISEGAWIAADNIRSEVPAKSSAKRSTIEIFGEEGEN